MKTRLLILGLAVTVVAVAQPAWAADTATSKVTVSATVSATAKLNLSIDTVTFANADPDAVASIPASEPAVTVTAKAKTSAGGSVTLTLLAADDLKSGSDTIPAGNVSWSASGGGFAAGALAKGSAVSVASWTGSGTHSGDLAFKLANSWSYATGTYSVSATYTLTAP
jgi:hypothetical protein